MNSTLTLLDGRQVPTDQISFDSGSYHFFLNSEDVTALIKRVDKQNNWPGFDPAVDNTRLYNESKGGAGPVEDLPTNTTGIFVDQILTDPLAAPIDALQSGIDSIKKGFQNYGLVIGIGAVVVLILIYGNRNK